MTLPAGAKLDSYEIVSPLGAGGMGEVYRARDTTLKRDVAIKVLPDFWSRDPERLRRFEIEAQAAATLNHPNVVSIFHVGRYYGSPYIVTELLQGETLRERLRHGAMPIREVLETGSSIAQGLAAAHAAGVVHRDLKPENIFLTKDGRVKILDFGLAKFDPVASESGSTVTVQQVTTKTIDGGLLVGFLALVRKSRPPTLHDGNEAAILASIEVKMAQPFSGIVGLWRMRSCADDRQQQTFCASRILIERNADSTLVKRDALGTPQAIVQRPPFVRLVQSFQVKVKDCLRMTDHRYNADKTTDQDSRSQLHRSVQVCLLEATKSRLGATQEYGKCSMARSVSGGLSSYGRSGSWAVRRQVAEKRLFRSLA